MTFTLIKSQWAPLSFGDSLLPTCITENDHFHFKENREDPVRLIMRGKIIFLGSFLSERIILPLIISLTGSSQFPLKWIESHSQRGLEMELKFFIK
jgi:hypothetical protein